MPRHLPTYRLHKPSGRAVVQWKPLFGPNPHYLPGKFRSAESLEAFAAIMRRIGESKRPTPPKRPGPAHVRHLSEMFTAFYHAMNGQMNYQDWRNTKRAMDVVARRYGSISPDDFDAMMLEECRDDMVALGWSRTQVNRQVGKIKRVFRWGIKFRFVKAETLGVLRELDGLKRGWTKAPERPRVRAVEWATVDRVLKFVPQTIADMLTVQWLTGMRSGEICGLTAAEVDRQGAVWKYVPAHHKKAWRGEERVIYFGPQARAILKRYMHKPGPLFTPADAIAERYARRKKPPKKPKIRKTLPGYSTAAYNKAVRYGFIQLGRSLGLEGKPQKDQHVGAWLAPKKVAYFFPYQLRHSRASQTRQLYGIEGSQAQLQDSFTASLVYAERSDALARRIARETG